MQQTTCPSCAAPQHPLGQLTSGRHRRRHRLHRTQASCAHLKDMRSCRRKCNMSICMPEGSALLGQFGEMGAAAPGAEYAGSATAGHALAAAEHAGAATAGRAQANADHAQTATAGHAQAVAEHAGTAVANAWHPTHLRRPCHLSSWQPPPAARPAPLRAAAAGWALGAARAPDCCRAKGQADVVLGTGTRLHWGRAGKPLEQHAWTVIEGHCAAPGWGAAWVRQGVPRLRGWEALHPHT